MTRTSVALGLLVLGPLLGLVAGTAPAAAHVKITASTTSAGATAVVRLEVPHGCAGSATTEVSVRMPEEVGELTVESTERWSVEQGGGGVTYRTDDPLPDALRDEVAFSVRLPDEVGTVLVFPVVQRCLEGEAAWTEVAENAASSEDLEMPAPVIVVTAADGAGAQAALPGNDHLTTYGAAGALAAGGLVAGAVLLARRRRA